MVYGIIQLINFAHGEIFMMGAFMGLLAVLALKVNIWAALLLAMAICMVLRIVIEFVAYRPLRKSSRLSALISSIGFDFPLHLGIVDFWRRRQGLSRKHLAGHPFPPRQRGYLICTGDNHPDRPRY
jgi:branched-subunit amino acid ABC-type transport system permease component